MAEKTTYLSAPLPNTTEKRTKRKRFIVITHPTGILSEIKLFIEHKKTRQDTVGLNSEINIKTYEFLRL
jgi:hypothetical protein